MPNYGAKRGRRPAGPACDVPAVGHRPLEVDGLALAVGRWAQFAQPLMLLVLCSPYTDRCAQAHANWNCPRQWRSLTSPSRAPAIATEDVRYGGGSAPPPRLSGNVVSNPPRNPGSQRPGVPGLGDHASLLTLLNCGSDVNGLPLTPL